MGDWIPTEERLPEEEGEYLITWTGTLAHTHTWHFIRVVEYIKYRDGFYWDTDDIYDYGYRDVEVIAWMPLPEPYKGENE
ncbi:MAG: DUF551 domain-containing protein [Bacteroidaceae bacterium]|nr:DUF551 domain-containing protein [Bacteroidaceae bacterium]